MHGRKLWGDRPFSKVTCHPDRLEEPLHVRKPARIGVCFMGDLFHEAVHESFIAKVFNVMRNSEHHTFLILTKRPARMCKMLSRWRSGCNPYGWVEEPLPNVWLGVSVEDQSQVNRIDDLANTPAALRFVSFEPLLGDIYLRDFRTLKIGRVIVGGESGPKARPCDLAWIRSVVEQCKAAGTACFVKQLGAHAYDSAVIGFPATGYVLAVEDGKFYLLTKDRKAGNPEEWPADLRVRELPEVRA